MDYSQGYELWHNQWRLIHSPNKKVFGWLQDEDEGEMVVENDKKIVEILELLHDVNYKNKDTLDLTRYGTGVFKANKVKLGNNKEYELVLVLKYNNGKNKVNPNKYGVDYKSYAMARNGKFKSFNLYTSFKKTCEIIVQDSSAGSLETYLFNDTILTVHIETTLINDNEINTLSSFNIDNGEVVGYIIEREGNPESEQWVRGKKKRIPGNIYEVIEDPCLTGRANCANEFRLITTPEKSGTRTGILIHKGSDYRDSEGCLLPIGADYKTEIIDYYINGELKEMVKYNSNGTSEETLNEINTYIEKKKQEAKNKEKTLKIYINLNR